MHPSSAPRVAAALLLAMLVIGVGAVPVGAATKPAAPAALVPRLRVSDHHPRQLRGVTFDASASTGPIAYYAFAYGDGVVELSHVPVMMHGYRMPGTYHAAVYLFDRGGHSAESARVTIQVKDGMPPTVRIGSPTPGKRLSLRPGGIGLRGTASDPNGVARVELAMELVSRQHRFKLPSGFCVWYDGGRDRLVGTGCSHPFFWKAHFSHGHWSFRIPAHAPLLRGNYVLRVRATDHAGNVSSYYAVPLHTVVQFTVVGT